MDPLNNGYYTIEDIKNAVVAGWYAHNDWYYDDEAGYRPAAPDLERFIDIYLKRLQSGTDNNK